MLLALDTATQQVGLALYDGAEVRHEVLLAGAARHTVALAPAVEQALANAGLTMADIAAVGVALGPGSFTGLRIGLALAKGLALTRGLPLLGIPTHDILAAGQPLNAGERLAAVVSAGRGRLAVRWYAAAEAGWQAEGEAQLLTAEELNKEIRSPTRVCGDLNDDTRKLLARKRKNVTLASPAASLRRAGYLAELAWARWQNNERDDPTTLAPIYLRTNQDLPE